MTPTKNYRDQDGCHNCEHRFVRQEYGEQDEYYCTLGAPPRPSCGTLNLGHWGQPPDSPYCETWDSKAWAQWSNGREVELWGICSMAKHSKEEKP